MRRGTFRDESDVRYPVPTKTVSGICAHRRLNQYAKVTLDMEPLVMNYQCLHRRQGGQADCSRAWTSREMD